MIYTGSGGLGFGGGTVCRFKYVARIAIKYMKISMRLRVAFDRADPKCLSGADIVSLG